MAPYSLHPHDWEKKDVHAAPSPAVGQSREMWSAEANGGEGGIDDGELCTYPLTRNCSKPSSVVAGNPWRYGPIYVTRIRTRETSDTRAYRPAAVVALAALDTVPREVSNTPTGVASFSSTTEAAMATPTSTVAASATTVPTAPATTVVTRIWAVARDMPSLTTAVALGAGAAAPTAAPPTATTTTAGGAVARL